MVCVRFCWYQWRRKRAQINDYETLNPSAIDFFLLAPLLVNKEDEWRERVGKMNIALITVALHSFLSMPIPAYGGWICLPVPLELKRNILQR
ncbi:hypothetical protein BC939DRAFT_469429 [Gamsiella multidivaricata]|uniref:uncharacterized protein n=1 Tax=Gamsiella multidivaricata TaxID=101098 RepID=UPI00221F4540|nr:uncharacterized protein BC939DRAFT_469429 [Gamsiella multidivaricata]KAI7816358.1 hypothetical protein BC939DRAFT_469429 [Gamsiella multidivaricata]